MPREASKTFTDKEVEIMRVVWDLTEDDLNEIREQAAARPVVAGLSRNAICCDGNVKQLIERGTK